MRERWRVNILAEVVCSVEPGVTYMCLRAARPAPELGVTHAGDSLTRHRRRVHIIGRTIPTQI